MQTNECQPVGPEFFREDMPLEQLHPSPMNPRKTFDEAKLLELAESFKGVGIIEPLVARPVNGHYEIVCGARRARAASLARLDTVPVIVKPLTDAQALEIMVIENNQREDVDALEEAEGFRRLLGTGYELDRLSERIGRSKKYIYDRIKLLDLVPEAKKLLTEGLISAGHAILIARQKPDNQERIINPAGGGLFQSEGATLGDDDYETGDGEPQPYVGMKPRTVRELERHIADHIRFDVKHAAHAAPLEFGEVAHRVEAASLKPGRGKKVVSITFSSYVQPDARADDSDRVYGPRSFKLADGQTHTDDYPRRTYVAPRCEHAVLGLVVVGERYGEAFDVCLARDKCRVHWKSEISEREKNQKLRDSGKADVAAKREQRAEDSWKVRQEKEEAARKEWTATLDKAWPLLAEHLKAQKVTPALVAMVIDRYHLRQVEELIGPVTEKNMGTALALEVVISSGTWNRAQFLQSVKPFKFNLGHLDKREKATPATADSKKPLKKKTLGTAKGVQTSARAKSANKKR